MLKQQLITKFEAKINYSQMNYPNRDYSKLMSYLKSQSFFDDPAARAHHNNFPGGLAQHVLNFTNALETLLSSFGNIKKSSDDYDPFLVAIGHDLNKVGSYNFSEVNKKVGTQWHNLKGYGYNEGSAKLPGNTISLGRMEQCMELSSAESLSIYWAEGSWSTYNNQNLDKAWKAAMNYDGRVYLAHVADMIASQLVEKTLDVFEVDKLIREWK